MNKKTLISSIVILMISLGIISNVYSKTKQVCFDYHCFDVELAVTQTQRDKGLMFRSHLDQNKGMLFVFDDEKKYAFWMKNTLISLDIIWINEEKKVVHISKDSPPCTESECPSIRTDQRAKYVLEVNANTCDKIGLKVGDKLEFSL